MKKNKPYPIIEKEEMTMVNDAVVTYQTSFAEMNISFRNHGMTSGFNNNVPTGLQPIVKWPGGKEKELKYILPNAPKFENYYEPFVGGGAVFMAIRAKKYFINDFSRELTALYQCIARSDKDFFSYTAHMDASWKRAELFLNDNPVLIEYYLKLRSGELSKENLKTVIHRFCHENKGHILNIIGTSFNAYPCILPEEIEVNLFRKMTRMRILEKEKRMLPDEDLHHNIETAIKSAVYMNYRNLYNSKEIAASNPPLQTALFFFIRNYAYSGMFRYSNKGDFNVPYGGIAYNGKFMAKKTTYYRAKSLLNHFTSTHIFNLDFEEFLRKTRPTERDFVFLDPPYDSEFSSYARNEFTRDDQKRLANYMINECKAKWMIVIKHTDFIYSLYDKAGINIRAFNKEYLVSFMNRNEKKVTHLLITNY